MAQPETRLAQRILKALREAHPGAFFYKQHGSNYMRAGLPDLIGCLDGRYVGLEVKVPGKEDTLTPRQQHTLNLIAEAGGIAAMVTSPEQALEALAERHVVP